MADTLTSDPSTWTGSSLVSVKQITPSGLQLLLDVSLEMKTIVRLVGGDERLKHKILANVFYEASTRTSCSFQSAMLRLGGRVVCIDQLNSSVKKGETLGDTIRCLENYADVTVLRHPVIGSAAEASTYAEKPVLNAGDGTGEHPTQALLDIFTITDEFRTSSGLLNKTVVLLGDLKHGRTVHSLAKLIARSGTAGVELRYCSPPSLRMPEDVKEEVSKYGVKQGEYTDIKDAIKGADVLYVTRVQKERFENLEDYENVKDSFIVDANLMKSAPSKMIVMHPLPRVGEITEEVDKDPRAAVLQTDGERYVRQDGSSRPCARKKVCAAWVQD
eukprot:CAMPEP_0118656936 /NCGR_PEP_ID=MMETSP0785-20121206/13744_1 /TAXON_ID=91992 /ORGANISM="Bolidomonas pacifica, Strain CCMP 1866" /LENGTH=330 /DNA_ID=CAMNT_0006549807 /DNA_START=10 /DNA_END=1001 /DNA_ORIENTATION=-